MERVLVWSWWWSVGGMAGVEGEDKVEGGWERMTY